MSVHRLLYRIRWTLSALAAAFILIASSSAAHELRPAYLELREQREGEYSVLWKTPMRGDLRLSLSPVFSTEVENVTPPTARETNDASIQTWIIRAPALRGEAIGIDGLAGTMTDALVRIEFANGRTWLERLTPQEPSARIPEKLSVWHVAGEYLKLGVEHILFGIDHLLFVLALIIITKGSWKLVKTVTAFTVSHSVTLSLAALGYVHMPSAPVEAIIALSIVFVAVEILNARRGRPSFAARAPWVVAFSFGLLHGLGFAGALSEMGLPEEHIPLALALFSVGVEVGHLMFVFFVLALIAMGRRSLRHVPDWVQLAPTYAIGSVATFWLIQRVSEF